MGVRLSTLVRRMRSEVPAGDSDTDLLARFARTGDPSAFELLVWRHGAMVLAACRRVLSHDEDAEDAFQAVFLVLAKKARGIGRGTALPAWLHRVAVRVATRLARSRKTPAPLEAEPAATPAPDLVANAETLRVLDEEIDRLPERCRRAVVLCYLEGLTAAEAAGRLGCPTGTVESRLASARRRLSARLSRRGVTLPAGILAIIGPVALAPDAVARVAWAGVLLGRGGVDAVVSEQSVRLAKGVLTMWRTRTWAALATVALAAVTVAAGVAWTDEAPRMPPPVPPGTAQPPLMQPPTPPPGAEPAKPAADVWGGKPVWVATTSAHLYDISPDGKRYLYSDGQKFGCFDREGGKLAWIIDNTTIHDAKFSPDGKTVAAGEWQDGVNFYDADTGQKTHALPAGEERPWQIHYRPDGTVLFHNSWSSFSNQPPWTMKYSIVHYDPTAKKQLGKVSDTIVYSTTNPWLWHRGAGFVMERLQIFGANTTERKTVSFTDPITGKTTPTVDLHVNDLVFDISPDGKTALAVTAGEQPRLIDTATGKTKLKLDGHKRLTTDCAFSPDGKLIVVVTGTDFLNSWHGVAYFEKVPEGPAECAVWDAVTGKLISRTEFPLTEHDFTSVRFSPDSKFFVATSKKGKGGKSLGAYAFGAVPFDKGGAVLTFPKDEEPKPKPPAGGVPNVPGALVADPLDRLVEELTKSKKTVTEKVDALFLAALGRFATEREQKWVKDTYGAALTADALRKLLAEIAKSPEFDAHIKSLLKRSPAKPAPIPGWPNTLPDGTPRFPGWPALPDGTQLYPGSDPTNYRLELRTRLGTGWPSPPEGIGGGPGYEPVTPPKKP